MSCYPNHLASYAGSGRPINYVDDGHNNDYRRLNVNANNDDDQRYCNNDDDHYHNRSISSRRSSEDYYYDRSSSEDYYDRHSSSDNYHHRRRSSFSDNSMQLSTSNNDDGQLLPGGRYVQRHHLNLTSSGDFSYDYVEYETPWEEDCWVPLTKNGKQKSRNELQRYIDKCKAEGATNQTRIIEQMGVNSNSFRKFMDPSIYCNQWNATSNGTYWAAAKLLARVAYEKELAKVTSGSGSKRKSTRDEYASDDEDDVVQVTKRFKSNSGEIKKTRAEVQLEALTLLRTITSVEGVPEIVYDSCPELVKKIKAFLARDGMTKSNFLLALGGLNSNSLNTFLAGKRQDQAGNVTYRRAYVFFEKLRILEGKPKSAARIGNEMEHPYGFSLEKPRNPRVLGQPYRPYGRSSNSAPMHDMFGVMRFF